MKKYLIIFCIVFSMSLYSITKENRGRFYSGIGIGYEQRYNNMLLPYEFYGSNYSINLHWSVLNSSKWLSNTYFSIAYSPVFSKNIAIDIPILNANQQCIGAKLQYNLLRKIDIFSKGNFRFFVGPNIDLRSGAEVFLYQDIQKYFLRTDLSLGASLFWEYDFGAFKMSNAFSMPIVTGSFYPHYNTVPFFSIGKNKDYFVVASIGSLNRVNNFLSVEIPFKIKGNLFTTFWLSYNFNYEYSTIRDNKLRIVSHNGLLGFVFYFCK